MMRNRNKSIGVPITMNISQNKHANSMLTRETRPAVTRAVAFGCFLLIINALLCYILQG